jgi:hypothetical protein
MFSRKRPVVQLTSLLDLLFIMIFIALTVPPVVPDPVEPDPIEPPIEKPEDATVEVAPDDLTEQLEQARKKNELLAAIDETPSESTQSSANIGEFRKLFVANLHYLRANYRYTETVIYSADNESGLYEYRVHLQGAGIVNTNAEPLTEDDVELIKVCDEVTLTREVIQQDCRLIHDRHLTIDCERTDDRHYQCNSRMVRKMPNGQLKTNRYKYKMELVKIYDPSLV